MTTMTTTPANLVMAPIDGLNAIYTTPGIDLFHSTPDDDALGGAEHLSWTEYTGPDAFDADTADDMLRAAGYRRTTPWDLLADYGQASIEAL